MTMKPRLLSAVEAKEEERKPPASEVRVVARRVG